LNSILSVYYTLEDLQRRFNQHGVGSEPGKINSKDFHLTMVQL